MYLEGIMKDAQGEVLLMELLAFDAVLVLLVLAADDLLVEG